MSIGNHGNTCFLQRSKWTLYLFKIIIHFGEGGSYHEGPQGVHCSGKSRVFWIWVFLFAYIYKLIISNDWMFAMVFVKRKPLSVSKGRGSAAGVEGVAASIACLSLHFYQNTTWQAPEAGECARWDARDIGADWANRANSVKKWCQWNQSILNG